MGVLARATVSQLKSAGSELGDLPSFTWIRRPETGMTMVRARAGGSGQPFNLGEMTVTRCALRTGDGFVGVAYVKGRDHELAELAALLDAMLQDPTQHDDIERRVIGLLEHHQQARRDSLKRKAAATKVDFFTLATEREDP